MKCFLAIGFVVFIQYLLHDDHARTRTYIYIYTRFLMNGGQKKTDLVARVQDASALETACPGQKTGAGHGLRFSRHGEADNIWVSHNPHRVLTPSWKRV